MKKMSLGQNSPLEPDAYERLLNVLDKSYATGINNGMPTAWLYDCTFAAVAVYMVHQAINSGEYSEDDVEKMVTDLEAVNFCVYGDVHMKASDPQDHITKKNFAINVVKPLYDAYKDNQQVQEAYPDADGLFGFIVHEWIDKP